MSHLFIHVFSEYRINGFLRCVFLETVCMLRHLEWLIVEFLHVDSHATLELMARYSTLNNGLLNITSDTNVLTNKTDSSIADSICPGIHIQN